MKDVTIFLPRELFILKTTKESNNIKVLNDKERAKNNILLMNRDRCKFSEINALLNQVETLYFDGNYTKAYEMSVQVLNRLKEKSGQVNQWFILIMQVALSP